MLLALAKKPSTDKTHKKQSNNNHRRYKNNYPVHQSAPVMLIQRKPPCPCGGGCPRCQQGGVPIQAKLKIGQPNDKYEQEADRMADQVMRIPVSQTQVAAHISGQTHIPQIQRTCSECKEEEEETVQTKPLAGQITPLVQRQESLGKEEDEELIQAKIAGDVTPEMTPTISSGIQSLQGGGKPLPGSERNFFEPRFGADFSNVRVHNDTRAASVARSVSARAFTFGRNVVFGAGEYSADKSSGRKLLAHELTHVVQQNGGPTLFSTGKNSENTIPMQQGTTYLLRKSTSRGMCPRREPDETAKSSKSLYELKERVPGREWVFFDFSVGIDSIESGKGNVKSVIEPIKDSIIRSSAKLFGGAIPYVVFPIKDKMLKVQGFTDCHGKDEINKPLRLSRAESFCSVVRRGDDSVAEFFQYQIKSCKGAPLDNMLTSNATVKGRRQNRSVLIKVISTPTPVAPSRTYQYDSTYGPSRDHCLSYLGTQVHFNKAYAQNAYCACLATPNEPHTNCVRKCLQVKRDKLILSAFNELRKGTFLWCPAVWLQHRQCYKECGCENAFIDYLLFSPMCKKSFGCPAVGLSINLFNLCMKT